jgi:hypothetical protein
VAVPEVGRPAPHDEEVGGTEPSRHPSAGPADAERVSANERLGILGNWRLLGTLVAGGSMLIVVATTLSSHAYFTTQSTSPDNAFHADEVDIDVANAGQLLNGTGLTPGVQRSGTQTITSFGHRARLELDATDLVGGALLDVLVVTVRQTAPTSVERYSGTIRALRDADLGVLQAAGAATYTVTVAWPADRTDPGLAGTSVSFDFLWTAVSVQ